MPRTLYESDLVGTNYVLSALSFLAVFFAIYIIITKNPIVSVLFLIGLFFTISVYLITIGLQFLGLVYLIVYVGAVSILFLFILMLINVRVSELLSDNSNSVSLAILTILCFNYCINDTLPFSVYLYNVFDAYNVKILANYLSSIMSLDILYNTEDTVASIFRYLFYVFVSTVTNKTWDAIIVTYSHITSIGNILYTNLLILFIITSLILLLAMVGAIIITINKSKSYNNLEWNLSSPSKPHALVSSPLKSKVLFKKGLMLESNVDPFLLLKLFNFNNCLNICGGVVVIVCSVHSVTSNIENLDERITELNNLLNPLQGFINQFNQTLLENNITTVMIEGGNIGVDYTDLDISEEAIQRITNLLDLLRTLIIQRESQIETVLDAIQRLDSERYTQLLEQYNQIKQTFNYH